MRISHYQHRFFQLLISNFHQHGNQWKLVTFCINNPALFSLLTQEWGHNMKKVKREQTVSHFSLFVWLPEGRKWIKTATSCNFISNGEAKAWHGIGSRLSVCCPSWSSRYSTWSYYLLSYSKQHSAGELLDVRFVICFSPHSQLFTLQCSNSDIFFVVFSFHTNMGLNAVCYASRSKPKINGSFFLAIKGHQRQ